MTPAPSAAPRRRLTGAARLVLSVGWYAVLISVAWFLEVWLSARVEPAAALRGLLLTVAIAGATTVVLTAALGRYRGAFAAAIVVVGLIGARDVLTVIALLAAIPLLAVERRWAAAGRVRLPWPRIHEGLFVVAVIVLAIQVARLATVGVPAPKMEPSAWETFTISPGERPNIYVILADAHARHDVLREWYGYDDTPTQDSLRAMGFDVASRSRANYLLTRFSLASMLTSSYLTELHEGRDPANADAFASRAIADNPSFSLLRRAGYEVVVVSSGYEHLGLRAADRFVDTGQPNELEDALIASTAVGRLALAIDPQLVLQAIRDRTFAELDVLGELSRDTAAQRPRFAFVHLPVPHWPYAFNAACDAADLADERLMASDPSLRLGSPEQVRFVREQTQCVDRLLQRSLRDLVAADPEAVILVLSDHGPQEYFDPESPSAAELDERSANLFAARTPGHHAVFPDDITLVNVIPRLFNAYLGTHLPLQPNQTWFGPRAQDGGFVLVPAGSATTPDVATP